MVLSEPRGRQASPGKVGRAVECTGLENRQGRKILVSSNLTPSAKTVLPDKLIEIMIDPEMIYPGAYATLDAKAIKLLGPRAMRTEGALPFPDIFNRRQADVFVRYKGRLIFARYGLR